MGFSSTGIDGMILSFEQLSAMPDEVVENILDAGAVVVVSAHKASIQAEGLIDTGVLKESIKAHKKRDNGRRYVLVYPEGPHHKYNRKEVTKTYANSKHGRAYTVGGDEKAVTANEVGFIQEFGAPKRHIRATQWMLKANEMSAGTMAAAEYAVYDDWLKSINL